MIEKVEGQLYRMGFVHEDSRVLVRNQILLTVGICILAALTGWYLRIMYDIAAGAVLMTFNFYQLAKFLQHVLMKQDGAVTNLLFRFYGRLILTGAAMAALIIWAGASVLGLLAGLSTVMVTILVWGLSRMTGKPSR